MRTCGRCLGFFVFLFGTLLPIFSADGTSGIQGAVATAEVASGERVKVIIINQSTEAPGNLAYDPTETSYRSFCRVQHGRTRVLEVILDTHVADLFFSTFFPCYFAYLYVRQDVLTG